MSPKFAPVLFGFVLSALMSLLVSGIATFRNAGLVDGFFNIWVNASNSESFFAQTTDGAVYSVGRNINGSSGVGHINEILVWTPVLVPAGKSLAKIYGGGNGNLFLMTDGTVYFAGANDTGGAGNDTKGGNISTMVQVPLPRPAFEIAATYYDSYAAILVP